MFNVSRFNVVKNGTTVRIASINGLWRFENTRDTLYEVRKLMLAKDVDEVYLQGWTTNRLGSNNMTYFLIRKDFIEKDVEEALMVLKKVKKIPFSD